MMQFHLNTTLGIGSIMYYRLIFDSNKNLNTTLCIGSIADNTIVDKYLKLFKYNTLYRFNTAPRATDVTNDGI